MSSETKLVLLDDLLAILSKSSHILSALGDLQRVFEKLIKTERTCFFAAKKIYFYNVWLNDEIVSEPDLVDTITASMRALVTGYRERITISELSSSKLDPAATANGIKIIPTYNNHDEE